MEALLGPELKGKNGMVSTSSLASVEVVGLYCSAHWCPPCRGFTPQLATIYTELKSCGKSFEIVFISSDKDSSQFDEYYAEQPWLALPFEDRERKSKLSSKFKVRGIPTLLLFNGATGELITSKGREAVMDLSAFPWKPPTLAEMLGGKLQGKDGTTDLATLKANGVKHLMLYFSAHWCPPCKAFTPKLAGTYKAMQAAGVPMEGIFVSSDKDQGSFEEYYAEMPWLALPFDERKLKDQLSSFFEVEGIPTLVTVAIEEDGELTVVNKDARGPASGDASGAEFPWAPKPVADFDEDPSSLNNVPCVVALMEKAEAEWEAVEEILTDAAVACKAAGKEIAFGTIKEMGGGIGSQIRKLCKLGMAQNKKVQCVLLNLPEEGAFHDGPAEVTAASIQTLLEQFEAGALERKQVS